MLEAVLKSKRELGQTMLMITHIRSRFHRLLHPLMLDGQIVREEKGSRSGQVRIRHNCRLAGHREPI